MPRKFLIVTEKHAPSLDQRDGGAMLVETLKAGLGPAADIIQFELGDSPRAPWRFTYPDQNPNRFARRLNNAQWVADTIANLAGDYTDIVFVHISMLFATQPKRLQGTRIWLFPMFMGASYEESGETIPSAYFKAEYEALLTADRILTPSHFERSQLRTRYAVPDAKIKVVPRGVRKFADLSPLCTKPLPLNLCSIGSIKPQKNTVGVVELFASLKKRFPEARLTLIGPVQSTRYWEEVLGAIHSHGLAASVNWTGHIAPEMLPGMLGSMHVHVSASRCETFGRTIFETLRLGLPNLIPQAPSPALEFLEGTQALTTYTDAEDFVNSAARIMSAHKSYAQLAQEAGALFDERILGRLLCAELLAKPSLLVSDFDGTIFHKSDPGLTRQSVERFNQQRPSIICSARSLSDLREQVARLGLTPDWLIGLSGGELERFDQTLEITHPLTEPELADLRQAHPDGHTIGRPGVPLQWVAATPYAPIGYRVETYSGKHYLNKNRTRKLTAILRLIQEMDWDGSVQAFGDGPHDYEFLAYFDGKLLGRNTAHPFLRAGTEHLS
jgi:glycosyltransferase involved in cell wall biosynthesis